MTTREIKLRVSDESALYSEMDPDRNMLSDDVIGYLTRVFLNKHRRLRENYVIRILSDTPIDEEHIKSTDGNLNSRRIYTLLAETDDGQADLSGRSRRGDPFPLAVSFRCDRNCRRGNPFHHGLGLHMGSDRHCDFTVSGAAAYAAQPRTPDPCGDHRPNGSAFKRNDCGLTTERKSRIVSQTSRSSLHQRREKHG